MKLFLLVSSFLLTTTYLFAQTSSSEQAKQKWTSGVIVMNETNSYGSRLFEPSFLKGIVFKRHLKPLSLRLGFEYVKTIYDPFEQPVCCDITNEDGYKNEYMFRLGIEKGIQINNFLKPYLALDFTRIKSFTDKTMDGGFAGMHHRQRAIYKAFGVIPTIGFEFRIIKFLSLTLETRLLIIHSKEKIEYEDLVYGGVKEYNKDESEKFHQRIGALTLNFSF